MNGASSHLSTPAISARDLQDRGFVLIDLPEQVDQVYAASISYRCKDEPAYRPCALYRGLDADAVLDCSFWEWNQAVEYGRVRFSGRPRSVYWNRYLNGMHNFGGAVLLRVEVLTAEGVAQFDQEFDLKPVIATYFDDWPALIKEVRGWDSCQPVGLTLEEPTAPTLSVRPGLTGMYRVVLGVHWPGINLGLQLDDDAAPSCLRAFQERAEYTHKVDKEVPWRITELGPTSELRLGPLSLTRRDGGVQPFGGLRYLKFEPVQIGAPPAVRAEKRVDWSGRRLAMYFEPFSWARMMDLTTPQAVEQAVRQYQAVGADEVHTQVVRLGSKSVHHSQVVERFDEGQVVGDDGVSDDGSQQMVRALDVLAQTQRACRAMGIEHYANIGLTACYPGTDFEDRISVQHPEYRQKHVLRFNRPETIRYAAEVVRELVAYQPDGVSIDCMRYPYHHTEQELLAFFEAVRAAMDEAGPPRLPLLVRFPAADVPYFRIIDELVRRNYVQSVVPSNLIMRRPTFPLKPYLRWRERGCRVYGILEGVKMPLWTDRGRQYQLTYDPADIREDVQRYFREGADGVFVYQGDKLVTDAYCRTAFRHDPTRYPSEEMASR